MPFFRRLGGAFDAFARRGTYLIRVTGEGLIGGFCFESTAGSGRDKRRMWCFVMPLFIPTTYLHFGFGAQIPRVNRTLPELPLNAGIGSPEMARLLEELRKEPPVEEDSFVTVRGTDEQRIARTIRVMLEDGLPRLRITMSLQGFYDSLDLGGRRDSHGCEAAACTAIRLGLVEEALERIRFANLLAGWESPLPNDVLPEWNDPQAKLRGWEVELLHRLNGLRELLGTGGLDAANAQLDVWERATCEALGIEDLRWSGGAEPGG